MLDRGARQDKPVTASKSHGSLRVLSIGIFDVRRLIEKNCTKLKAAVLVDIASQKGIACNHEIAFGNLWKQLVPRRALNAQHFELRHKISRFARPIEDQGGWADDQRCSLQWT